MKSINIVLIIFILSGVTFSCQAKLSNDYIYIENYTFRGFSFSEDIITLKNIRLYLFDETKYNEYMNKHIKDIDTEINQIKIYTENKNVELLNWKTQICGSIKNGDMRYLEVNLELKLRVIDNDYINKITISDFRNTVYEKEFDVLIKKNNNKELIKKNTLFSKNKYPSFHVDNYDEYCYKYHPEIEKKNEQGHYYKTWQVRLENISDENIEIKALKLPLISSDQYKIVFYVEEKSNEVFVSNLQLSNDIIINLKQKDVINLSIYKKAKKKKFNLLFEDFKPILSFSYNDKNYIINKFNNIKVNSYGGRY